MTANEDQFVSEFEDPDDFSDYWVNHIKRNTFAKLPTTSVKRSSYSQPRTSFCPSEAGTISSDFSSGSDYTMRKRFSAIPRSKSFGRDPRMRDLMNAYQARTEEDTVSRDSGTCSGGTPDLGWMGRVVARGNSFPQTGDSYSLYGGQSDTRQRTECLDTRSVQSLDSHMLNWAPLSEEIRPNLSGKRKFSTFAEAISDDDEEEMVAKRPRTPDNEDNALIRGERSRFVYYVKKALRLCLKLFSLLVMVLLCLLCFATYKNWQCSHNRSLPINIDHISTQLSSELFGQQLAASELVSSLQTFTETPQSPVHVLILFGWLGSGKTYTANLLSSLFPVQSNTHYITCSLPHSVSSIPAQIARSCGHSMLVLDDLDYADKGSIDMLDELIKSIHNEPNSKSNGTLVVATTSAGGHSVNRLLLEMSKTSLSARDSLTSEHVMSALAADQVNIPLYKTLQASNIPVKLIPFLPLSREHLRMCSKRLALEQGITISDLQVNMILDQVQYFSKDLPIFAKTGCKQISAKLDQLMGEL